VAERAARGAVQVQQLFDSKAAAWPAKYAPSGRLAERLVRMSAVVRRCASPGDAILDLGCATGELARDLASNGMRVTAADISGAMLRQAKAANGSQAVEWIRLDPDWQVLPLQSRAFDTVIATSVLEYVQQPHMIIAECARVLKPGGVLVFTVPDVRHPIRWAEAAARLAAFLLVGISASGRLPRLRAHLAYLRTSRQRHRLPWWRAAAELAGLRGDPALAGESRISALRLLTFRRAADERELV
jgi:2-polyprenyl-3-methyl-5-hydroxy-6-metoxy-1,4-benzoquinol methylase